MRFEGKVAVVTGGAQGIGKAHVERFAAEGASVVVVDVQAEAAAEVAASIPKGVAVGADVSNTADTLRVAEEAVAAFGRIDILVNNAGGAWASDRGDGIEWAPRRNTLTELETDWDRMIAVNLKGQFLCVRAVAPHMKDAGRGKVVNIASIAGVRGRLGLNAYAAAKAGVIGLTKTMARDLGSDNIWVNAVAPGRIHSKDISLVTNPEQMQRDDDRALELQCIKQVGRPEHIAAVSAFLASSDSDFMTGEVLVVDGGRAIGL